jgi:general secretion pathway protein G
MKKTLPIAARQAGFTLFEIMLVLAIIAVLVGSAIYLVGGNVEVAKMNRVDADFQAITTQLKAYQMMNYNFPTTAQGLNALKERPTTDPKPRRWVQLLTEVPPDPWGNPYQYRSPGTRNKGGFDLWTVGPDGVSDTEDDIYYQ